jgi:imidazolonepropionase-like amidohydrolase
MKRVVLLCGKLFDGVSDSLVGPMEILIEGNHIANIAPSVGRPPDAELVDLSSRTVCPGFIDTHVHLTMDASRLAEQSLDI